MKTRQFRYGGIQELGQNQLTRVNDLLRPQNVNDCWYDALSYSRFLFLTHVLWVSLSQTTDRSDSDDNATRGWSDNHVLVTASQVTTSPGRAIIFEVTHSSHFHIEALQGHIAYLTNSWVCQSVENRLPNRRALKTSPSNVLNVKWKTKQKQNGEYSDRWKQSYGNKKNQKNQNQKLPAASSLIDQSNIIWASSRTSGRPTRMIHVFLGDRQNPISYFDFLIRLLARTTTALQ